jgi:hypothetical protein
MDDLWNQAIVKNLDPAMQNQVLFTLSTWPDGRPADVDKSRWRLARDI